MEDGVWLVVFPPLAPIRPVREEQPEGDLVIPSLDYKPNRGYPTCSSFAALMAEANSVVITSTARPLADS